MGTNQALSIQAYLDENFNPGSRVELLLQVPEDLSVGQLATIEASLQSVNAKVAVGSTGEWPNALRIEFTKSSRHDKTKIIPFAVMLVGALAAAGIVGILGWKLGNSVSTIGDAIAKNVVWIAGIAAVGLVVYMNKRTSGV